MLHVSVSPCNLGSYKLITPALHPDRPVLADKLCVRPTSDQEVAGSNPEGPGKILMEIDHEIFSTVILSLPLIQEGQLSVPGERMCTILVNHLVD